MKDFKLLLPQPNSKKIGCCNPLDYTKKHYHPHCCPGKKRNSDTCSDHEYPGHFTSVIRYPMNPDACNKELPFQYYHHKKRVISNYPWVIPEEKSYYKTFNIIHVPNYNKTDCGCGK